MSDLISPQVLKGFRDSLPFQEIPKKALIAQLEKSFESYGFVPIDTPVLEYSEILLGKGGGETEKQMFRFQDNGGRDVALRFDLTVPFARFMAGNLPQLPIPFKRYHIAKVWRGEKPQKGRYREFFQCDCDVVGVDTASADFEILQIMAHSMKTIGAGDITIHVNHRGIFNRFLEKLGIKDQSVEILRTVDKLAKIGQEEVVTLLTELSDAQKAQTILEFVSAKGSYLEVLQKMETLAGGEGPDTQRMKELWTLMTTLGVQNQFQLNPSITRGLDYYTGLVFETFLNALPQIGSICSGGRYNNLAGLYTKEHLPGIGGSIGLDRLLAGLEELGKTKPAMGNTQALILFQKEELVPQYHLLAQKMRENGIITEVFLMEKKPLAQYKYAEIKGIPFVITQVVHDKDHFTLQIKYIPAADVKQDLTLDAAIEWIKTVSQ